MKSSLLFLAMVPAFAFADEITGTWKMHPSVDYANTRSGAHMLQAFSGPRYAYFVMRGRGLDRNSVGRSAVELEITYNKELNFLFRFDRQNPEKGVYPLANDIELSKQKIAFAEYSPVCGRMVIVYPDGSLDIVSEDGDVKKVDALRSVTFSGSKAPRSVTFDLDGRSFYLSSDIGYMKFDIMTGDCLEFVKLNRPVHEVVRVGDKMVYLVPPVSSKVIRVNKDAGVYVAKVGETPDFSAVQKIDLLGTLPSAGYNQTAGVISSPTKLYPLTDNTFAFAAMQNATNYGIFVMRLMEDGSCKGAMIANDGIVSAEETGATENNCHRSLLDGNILPWKDGFFAHIGNHLCTVRRGQDFNPDATDPIGDFRNRAASFIEHRNSCLTGRLESNEQYRKLATWDGSEFFVYCPGKGILQRELSVTDSSVWPVKSTWGEPKLHKFNVDRSGISVWMEWHPELGMVTKNIGFREIIMPTSYTATVGSLDAYRDGKWTDLSRFGMGKTGGIETYCSYFTGLTFDPLAPEYYYTVSNSYGIQRHKIGDPDDLLILGNSKTTALQDQKGFVDAGIAISNLSPAHCCFTPVVFDKNGTMWASNDYIASDIRNILYYWTAEDRLACKDLVNDHSLYDSHKMGSLSVPGNYNTRTSTMIALKGEGSENKLVFNTNRVVADDRWPFIYDHNGTLADASDDRYVDLRDLQNKSTNLLIPKTYNLYSVAEDPIRNEVWMLTDNGVFIFNSIDVFSETPEYWDLEVSDMTGIDSGLQNVVVICMTIDNSGRKWLGTLGMGVYVISADNSTVLAHLTTENSQLPDNMVRSVAVNHDTNGIWIATDSGNCEFIPAHTDASSSQLKGICAIPSEITSDYKGYVEFHGLNDSKSYMIVDAEGNKIADLDSVSGGCSHWNARTAKPKLATGVYNLVDREDMKSPVLEIKVLR